MKEYFIKIMTSSVVSAICVSLSSGTVFEKYMKYVCALICASVIVFPLSGLINISESKAKDAFTVSYEAPDGISSGEFASSYASEECKNYIAGILKEKFGIIPRDISIDIDIGDGITVGNITVILDKEDEDKRIQVGDFLLSVLGGGIRVVTDE